MQSEIEFELNENGYQSGQSSNFYVLFQSALGFFRLLCLTVELNVYTPTRNVGGTKLFYWAACVRKDTFSSGRPSLVLTAKVNRSYLIGIQMEEVARNLLLVEPSPPRTFSSHTLIIWHLEKPKKQPFATQLEARAVQRLSK